MNIAGYIKTSLVDYGDHITSTVFTKGCNLRCSFCHNKELVTALSDDFIPEDEYLNFLSSRKNVLEAVCITGGEPTLQKDLLSFIQKIKQIGLKVKLDTNGTNPYVLETLCQKNLVDYVAIDIKNTLSTYLDTSGLTTSNPFAFSASEVATFNPVFTHSVIGLLTDTSLHAHPLGKLFYSMQMLYTYNIPHEYRTTILKEYHHFQELREIAHFLPMESYWYLQNYTYSKNQIIDFNFTSYGEQEIKKIHQELLRIHEFTFLRGF